MPKIYSGVCLTCGRSYKGRGKFFCGNHCRVIWTNTHNNVAKREDVKEKIRKSRIGKPTISNEKHWNWKGKKLTHLFCEDCGAILKSIPYGKRKPKYCKKCVHKHRQPMSEETKEKIRMAKIGKSCPHTKEWNQKIGYAGRKVKHTWLIGLKKSEETIAKLKQSNKEWWSNPYNAEKRFREMQRKPTRPELMVLNFLNRAFPKEWKYVGDGKFWIDGKNPDFINYKKKVIIEFDGIYWHKERKDQDKIRNSIYAMHGYLTLSINENDLALGYEHVKKKVGDLYDSY